VDSKLSRSRHRTLQHQHAAAAEEQDARWVAPGYASLENYLIPGHQNSSAASRTAEKGGRLLVLALVQSPASVNQRRRSL